MNDLLIGLLSALVATNPPAVVSNIVQQKTGLRVVVADANDPVEQAYQKLMAEDDAAKAEVEGWIKARNNSGFAQTDVEQVSLNARIKRRYEPVIKGYEEFLRVNPEHANARIAYGSFLNDIGDEAEAEAQWKKATEVAPKNPASWNNLANHYGHNGDVKKSFDYYAKAMELDPTEPVYVQNLATTTFLFRQDAMEHYKITEEQVFGRAMDLYRKALALDPENFKLAAELAQTYYGIKPPKSDNTNVTRAAELKLGDEALAAWRAAQTLSGNDLEREGIHLHFARWQINMGRYADARKNLASVTNDIWSVTKKNLTKKLDARDPAVAETNAPTSAIKSVQP